MYQPVCANGKISFDNACEAACQGFTIFNTGSCGNAAAVNILSEVPIIGDIDCSQCEEGDLVCAEGQTFTSMCAAKCSGFNEYTLGECSPTLVMEIQNPSCKGRCGQPYAKNGCFCDDQCYIKGDCCPDWSQLCPDLASDAAQSLARVYGVDFSRVEEAVAFDVSPATLNWSNSEYSNGIQAETIETAKQEIAGRKKKKKRRKPKFSGLPDIDAPVLNGASDYVTLPAHGRWDDMTSILMEATRSSLPDGSTLSSSLPAWTSESPYTPTSTPGVQANTHDEQAHAFK